MVGSKSSVCERFLFSLKREFEVWLANKRLAPRHDTTARRALNCYKSSLVWLVQLILFAFMLDNILQLSLAASLISLALFDVFQTVVVPRWTSRRWRIAPHLIEVLWHFWLFVAERLRDKRRRDDWLGTFAPLSVIVILIAWVGALTCGYGLIIYTLRDQVNEHPTTFAGSCYIAGTSFLTIGYGDYVPATNLMRFIFLTAAAAGLATFALVISWLFTLYQSFARREALVLTLDARAGSPPSGVMLLQTYAALEMTGELHPTFSAWEFWTADMLDSHLAFPLLPFFRSSHDDQSWISAMGAVLDAATLVISTVESAPQGEKLGLGSAHMMYRLGCHAVTDLSNYFRLRLPRKLREYKEGVPHPGVENHEWLAARRALQKAGYSLKPSEESWQDFAEKRAAYAWQLNNLAKLFAAAPSQWIGDRTTLPYLQPHPHQEKVLEAIEEIKIAEAKTESQAL